jgi:hypothetical protein
MAIHQWRVVGAGPQYPSAESTWDAWHERKAVPLRGRRHRRNETLATPDDTNSRPGQVDGFVNQRWVVGDEKPAIGFGSRLPSMSW